MSNNLVIEWKSMREAWAADYGPILLAWNRGESWRVGRYVRPGAIGDDGDSLPPELCGWQWDGKEPGDPDPDWWANVPHPTYR